LIRTLKGWRNSLAAVYAHPRMRTMLLLGFSSGLPLPLVLMTLSAWLRQSGVERTHIGYFGWVGLAYSLKFFWAPLVDRLKLPLLHRLGRRRSWMFLAQYCTAIGLLQMGKLEPISTANAAHIALLAALTAFASATQDIAVDAYRIEAVRSGLQGAMSAAYAMGYQLALLVSGAGALFTASAYGWTTAYCLIALCLTVGMLTTLLMSEPEGHIDRATLAKEARVVVFLERSTHWPSGLRRAMAWLIGAVVCPFVDFFQRSGLRTGLPILALIVTYRLNYSTMGAAATPFYIDMGFTLTQIATVSKIYGVIMTMAAGLIAGVLVARQGVLRTMLTGWVLLSAANLFYAYIVDKGHDIWWLTAAISIDNLGNGIAGIAFIAYMSSLTNVTYTATQYALFGLLWSLPAKTIGGFWGTIVDAFGYRPFFIYTAVVGLPALMLMLWLLRKPPEAQASGNENALETGPS
jgi:PAT family beta-lactamase induction signal transducer AmpG